MKLTSRSGRHVGGVELQMTSMIDVVFLLLIFFMTTSSFVRSERELDPAVKVQSTSSGSSQNTLEPAIVEIVAVGSDFQYQLGGRQLATAAELTQVLRQLDNKLDGAFVRVPDEAPFSMAAAAIQACKDAKFAAVSYIPMEASR